MQEVFVNSTPDITLDLSGATGVTDVTADFYAENGSTSTATIVATETSGIWSAAMPFALTTKTQKAKVVWHYTVGGTIYSKTDYIQVVSPYITINEARSWGGNWADSAKISDADIIRLEKLARNLINQVTRQVFEGFEGSITVWGSGDGSLPLPQRVYRLDSVMYTADQSYNLTQYGIYLDGDMQTLRYPMPGGVYDVKSDWPPAGEIMSSSPITIPYGYFSQFTFMQATQYTISGGFGWEAVPSDIKLAAELLMKDFNSPQDQWRKHLVQQMQSGTWQFQFSDDVNASPTGNRDVDKILLQYTDFGMIVI